MSKDPIAYVGRQDGSGHLCLGIAEELVFYKEVDWERLDEFVASNKGKFLVTMLAYDLKNNIEKLSSENPSLLDTPVLIYIVPKAVYKIEQDEFHWVYGESVNSEVGDLLSASIQQVVRFNLKSTLSKSEYLEQVRKVQHEIQIGNCYELNFCQNFESNDVPNFDGWQAFRYLKENTRAPFSGFFSWGGFTMLGASPERFIQKKGGKLISQPIKGTRPRKTNKLEDEAMKMELLNNTKERAENVMIVDLVRNDLARIAKSGSVKVDELFGIYSFHAVHQMISTISCELRETVNHSDIIKALFPMGSMTGAPKISAMQIIDRLENFQRGWYSGSLGLIEPNGDFDMNVVIRTLLYDAKRQYLCCPVGSAITILSEPEQEYEECLVKINRILSLFA